MHEPAPDAAALLAEPDYAGVVGLLSRAFGAAGLYYGHGTATAVDEAAWLVAWQGGIDYAADDWPAAFDTWLQRPVTAEAAARIAEIAGQRISTRKPLAYLLGEAWFAGLRFIVTEDVLVPRSPLAALVGRGFEPWVDAGRIGRVLDIGTGSGCIAIAAAMALPDAQVDASDVSPAALAVAARNVALHGLGDRLRLIKANLLDSPAFGRYDVIVSNPPYVDDEDMRARPAEYHHEPALGLAAGRDGLDLVRVMLAQAAGFLNDGGVLIIEVGNSDEALQREYAEVPFTWLSLDDDSRGVMLLGKAELQTHAELLEARQHGTSDDR